MSFGRMKAWSACSGSCRVHRQLVSRPCTVLLHTCRRSASHVAYFRVSGTIDERGIARLPIEGQELLGLARNEIVKDSELNAAYEDLFSATVESGFSEATVASRQEVLDYIRSDIFNNKGRDKSHPRDLNLPADLLPGALALMTEVGQCQLALNLGEDLLQSPEALSPAARRDVFLSMALAECGLASDALQSNTPQILQGCGHLEAALRHLEAAGQPSPAPALAAEITTGLKSLRLQSAMEQLSGTLEPETAEGRKRAVRAVRDAIRAQSAAHAAAGPAPEPLGPLGRAVGMRLGGAAAGVGAAARGPSAAGASGAGTTVTGETMETLMGLLTCEEVVHLLEWEQVARNPAAHKWLYPGLLEAVAVGHIVHGFVMRQPAYIKMALSLVQLLPPGPDLLAVEAVCRMLLGEVAEAAAALKQAERPSSTSSAPHPTASHALPPSGDAYRFVAATSAGSAEDDGLLPGLCVFTERWLTAAAFPFFRDTAAPGMQPASLVSYFDDTRVETLLTVYDARAGGALAETVAEAFGAIRRGLRSAASAGLLSAEAAGQGLDGAAADPAALQRQRLLRLLGGAALLAAALLGGLLSRQGQPALGRGEAPAAALMRQSAPLQPLTAAPEDFDATVARRLIETWQSAKAWALGAYHTTDQLPLLLGEPLLAETLDKVATLRGHGAHMRFRLQKLQVTSVRRVGHKAGPAVRIAAALEENADLHNDADGAPVNTCRRAYDAEYTAVQGRDGVWRMHACAVVERENSGGLRGSGY